MAVDSIYTITLNYNLMGIITTGILIGTFCVLSALFYFYIDRDRLILYLMVYFFFVFCNLFVSSICQFIHLGYYSHLSLELMDSFQLLFDYYIVYSLFSMSIFILQQKIATISWLLVVSIPIFILFGYYNELSVPIFLSYLTIILGIGLTLVIYALTHGAHEKYSILAITIVLTYIYFFISYVSSIGSHQFGSPLFDSIDWIISLVVVSISTIYFLYRYKVLINEKETLYERLIHDNLTGLYSKNYLIEVVTRLESGTILFIDINNFKQINDFYGHLVGDQVLSRFSETLLTVTHGLSIIPSRYGGDEFVLLIENASLEEVQLYTTFLFGSFRDLLKELSINYLHSNIGISVGISKFSQYNGNKAIVSADFSMYESKSLGNNHFTIHLEEVV